MKKNEENQQQQQKRKKKRNWGAGNAEPRDWPDLLFFLNSLRLALKKKMRRHGQPPGVTEFFFLYRVFL